jgi:hypothetical protein
MASFFFFLNFLNFFFFLIYFLQYDNFKNFSFIDVKIFCKKISRSYQDLDLKILAFFQQKLIECNFFKGKKNYEIAKKTFQEKKKLKKFNINFKTKNQKSNKFISLSDKVDFFRWKPPKRWTFDFETFSKKKNIEIFSDKYIHSKYKFKNQNFNLKKTPFEIFLSQAPQKINIREKNFKLFKYKKKNYLKKPISINLQLKNFFKMNILKVSTINFFTENKFGFFFKDFNFKNKTKKKKRNLKKEIFKLENLDSSNFKKKESFFLKTDLIINKNLIKKSIEINLHLFKKFKKNLLKNTRFMIFNFSPNFDRKKRFEKQKIVFFLIDFLEAVSKGWLFLKQFNPLGDIYVKCPISNHFSNSIYKTIKNLSTSI